MVYLTGASYTQVVVEKRPLNGCSSSSNWSIMELAQHRAAPVKMTGYRKTE